MGPLVRTLGVALSLAYYQCIRWRVGGRLFPARQYSSVFHRPGLVGRALRGERLPAPALMPLSRSGSWFRPSSGSQR